MSKRTLILEDGMIFEGEAFGSSEVTMGEVVFQTGMTGYQEMLSDPSYCDQMIVLTNPLIGNYGMNRDDYETTQPLAKALIVREVCQTPSNFRSQTSLAEALLEFNIPGLTGIDTRQLTRHLRSKGVMRGLLVDGEYELAEQLERIQQMKLTTDQVKRASTERAYIIPGAGPRIVLVDFGAKLGIIRELVRRGCEVVVVPHDVTSKEVLRYVPDGVMLSNGPGNPKDVPTAIPLIQELTGQVVIFGICLGHQLIALAHGADTFKLPFGHRGANHPVEDLRTGQVSITSQNHGYAVDAQSLSGLELQWTHRAINDGTVEGIRHTIHPVFSVQYHPEASPGPMDANDLFDQFLTEITNQQEVSHA
ncbi:MULTISPECIES: carbamoyl phosphate synthase small subunit [Exiguobacterium]|uniref:Carbamoyl phosphate synthase small chain n=1 Tax=Exiguobacterium antarcticum TaxID=132920 RepID=A0ABT6QYM1_9BACL|nr:MULTISPECIES: carbamoyl phosphate synthase small subunit [Exiguobacterium]AFS70903.1 Carbamoyl-phosphate synthase pyrimidine-specific small chain [Exiguobacterium antarcticum B7]MCT4779078.1 carbamoyl phosphate synthase small subunit [Exiguobacterium soli]MDI3233784.1 carbamoyl phosphate synthase small subunit [Exiguobacterium antarcticum]